MGYLDSNGLAHLWSKIRAVLSGKQDKLAGAAGQVVGFDDQGRAAAQEAPSSIPSGGSTGQALVKASEKDGDVRWRDTVTPQQVEEAIDAAITGAMEEAY